MVLSALFNLLPFHHTKGRNLKVWDDGEEQEHVELWSTGKMSNNITQQGDGTQIRTTTTHSPITYTTNTNNKWNMTTLLIQNEKEYRRGCDA